MITPVAGLSANFDVLDATDIDNGAVLSIVELNGETATVGSPITLASGASVTLLADGTVDYDENGVFGIVGGNDSFTYTVADEHGGTDTATFNITVSESSVPPIVIDLDGDGAEFTSIEDGIEFDIDGDGENEQVAWAETTMPSWYLTKTKTMT